MQSLTFVLQEGFHQIGPELNMWKEEVKSKFLCDAILDQFPGDYEIMWKFDNKSTINEWTISADSDHNEGYSWAEFTLGKNRTGIFKGHIDTTVPKDGKTKSAGYVNMRSPRNFVR